MTTTTQQHLELKSFKLHPADVKKLERIAGAIAGGNTTNVVRQLIRQVDEKEIKPDHNLQTPYPN